MRKTSTFLIPSEKIIIQIPTKKTEEENLAIIFGSDYDYIADRIKEILGSWKLIDKEN